jgi:hypothetical protein
MSAVPTSMRGLPGALFLVTLITVLAMLIAMAYRIR